MKIASGGEIGFLFSKTVDHTKVVIYISRQF